MIAMCGYHRHVRRSARHRVRVSWTVRAVVLLTLAILPETGRAGTAAVVFENDRAAATDRHYTHGSLAVWTSAPGAVPDGLRDLGAAFPGLATPPERVSYLLGQTMFTPDNISAARLVEDDRPYAGWLYGGLRLTSEQPGARQRLEINVGVVGPPSLADQTQTLVHRLIDVQVPNGWEHQLDTEPGLVAIYERGWRRIEQTGIRGLEVAATPHVGAALGNVFTLAAVGGRLAIGRNLDATWGPPRIFPGSRGSGYHDTRDTWHGSLFVGLEGRAVGRNIFLDGNTFSNSHSVSRNNVVGDIRAGLEIAHGPVRAAFTWVGRSREFEGQSENDQFASMTVSVRF